MGIHSVLRVRGGFFWGAGRAWEATLKVTCHVHSREKLQKYLVTVMTLGRTFLLSLTWSPHCALAGYRAQW